MKRKTNPGTGSWFWPKATVRRGTTAHTLLGLRLKRRGLLGSVLLAWSNRQSGPTGLQPSGLLTQGVERSRGHRTRVWRGACRQPGGQGGKRWPRWAPTGALGKEPGWGLTEEVARQWGGRESEVKAELNWRGGEEGARWWLSPRRGDDVDGTTKFSMRGGASTMVAVKKGNEGGELLVVCFEGRRAGERNGTRRHQATPFLNDVAGSRGRRGGGDRGVRGATHGRRGWGGWSRPTAVCADDATLSEQGSARGLWRMGPDRQRKGEGEARGPAREKGKWVESEGIERFFIYSNKL
jgi:hypothetical protein